MTIKQEPAYDPWEDYPIMSPRKRIALTSLVVGAGIAIMALAGCEKVDKTKTARVSSINYARSDAETMDVEYDKTLKEPVSVYWEKLDLRFDDGSIGHQEYRIKDLSVDQQKRKWGSALLDRNGNPMYEHNRVYGVIDPARAGLDIGSKVEIVGAGKNKKEFKMSMNCLEPKIIAQ